LIRKSFFLFPFFLYLLPSVFCFALEPEIYHWRSFTKLNGLAGNDVHAIFQDDSGRIWVGTSSGLSMFDGIWHNFTSADGIPSDEVYAICQGHDGRIWIGTNMGVGFFDGRHWDNIHFDDDPLGDFVLSAMADQEGIWIGTYRGANRFDGQGWTLWAQNDGYLFTGVRSMLRDSFGRMWFGMEASALYSVLISRFDEGGWTRYTVTDGLPEGRVLGIVEDGEGYIWMAAPMGVGVFDGERWNGISFPEEVVAIDVDHNGHVWVLTRSELMRYENGEWIKVLLPSQAKRPQSLLLDDAGGIWVGTRGNGLFFCDRGMRILSIPDVTALSRDESGRTWIGTGGGITLLSTGEEISIPLGHVRALLPDRDGLWVAFKGGLVRIQGDPPQIVERIDRLPYDDVRAIYKDSSGAMWIGVGLFVSGPGGIANRFSSLVYISDSGERAVHSLKATPSSIVEDGSGNIWIGTLGDGLARISPDGWTWFRGGSGPPGDIVTSLLCDDQGRIWVGTTEGVGIFDGERWSVLNIFSGDLLDNRVQAIAQDNLGRVWIGTREGISVVWNGISTVFSTADGLPSNDVTSLFVDEVGWVWIGTSAGVVRYSRETREPQTRIISGPRGVIGTTSAFFEFDGGDADTPSGELLFSWRIDDGSWSPPSPSKFANIPYLQDKMKHTFYVRAYDKNGNFDSTPASVSFYVNAAPPSVDVIDPPRNSVVGGVVRLRGTAYDDDFQEYLLQVDGTTIAASKTPIRNDMLAKWDTRPFRDGDHVVTLIARDKVEGPYDVQHENGISIILTVDNTPPRLSLISPTSGQKLRGEVEIRFAFEDAHPESYVVEYRQEEMTGGLLPTLAGRKEGWKTIGSGNLSANDREMTVRWVTSEIYGGASLRIRVTDRAGNTGKAEINVFLDNERARPVVSISSPAQGEVVSGVIKVIGTADDPTLISYTLEYRSASKTEWNLITNTPSSGVNEEVLGIWDTRQIADGEYILRLTGYDDNGYSSSASISLLLDNTPPEVGFILPREGEVIPSSADTEIRGTAWDVNFERFILECSTGEGSGEWVPIASSDSPVRDGLLTLWNAIGFYGRCLLRLTGYDRAGLAAQVIREIYVDPSPAKVEIRSPKEGDVVSGEVEIYGIVSDDNLRSYRLLFRAEWEDRWIEIAEGTTSRDGMLGSWRTSGLNGRYLLKLEADDKAGHESSTSLTLIVDNTPPLLSITSPRSDEQVVGDVKVEGRIEDITRIRYLVEFGEGESPERWYKLAEGTASDSSRRQLAVWNVSARDGPYTLRVKTWDSAGFETVSSVSVIVPRIIVRDKGGETVSADGCAKLIVPPGSLILPSAQIAINPIREGEKPTYRIEPEEIRFDPARPSILVISLDEMRIEKHKVAVERWDEGMGRWRPLGGSIDHLRNLISIPITSGGRYRIASSVPPPTEGRDVIEGLICQPRALIPDEGIFGRIWITFKVNRSAGVKLRIYDMSGKVQKTILRGGRIGPGVKSICWDGKDDEGKPLSSGPYFVSVEAGGVRLRKGIIIWRR
jgi:ligand-binding sensor domain-containing protein